MRAFLSIFLCATLVAGAGVQWGGASYAYNYVGGIKTNPNDLTIGCFFRRSDSMVPGDWCMGARFGTGLEFFGVGLSATNILYAQVYSAPGQTAYYTNTISTDWHHIAATLETSKIVLYFDGSPVSTNTTAWYITPGTGWQCLMQIAGIEWGGTVYSHFLGELAEVFLFDRVLTPAEIAATAAGQSPKMLSGDLVFYEPFAVTNGWNVTRSPRTVFSGTVPNPASHPKTYRP